LSASGQRRSDAGDQQRGNLGRFGPACAVGGAPEPTCPAVPFSRIGRLPGAHGRVVLAARVRITDALHHAQVPVVEQSSKPLQPRMEAEHRIDLVQLRGRQGQRRATLGVQIESVGDDSVQAVVAAGKLDHDDRRLPQARFGRCQSGTGQERRHAGTQRNKHGRTDRGLEKISPCGCHGFSSCDR